MNCDPRENSSSPGRAQQCRLGTFYSSNGECLFPSNRTSSLGIQEVNQQLPVKRNAYRLSTADRRRSNGETEPLLGASSLRRVSTMPTHARSSRSMVESGNNAVETPLPSGTNSLTDIAGFCTSEYEEVMAGLPESERDVGERLRRHLQFFFMDPMMKWRVRRQFPFKLALQVLKIIFITIQLILFAELRMSHIDFMDDTNTVMRHKFLKKWNDERDTLVYPPSAGKYSVYTGADIIAQFAFMVDAYYMIQEDSFASFSYDTSLVHREKRNEILHGEEATATKKIHFNQIPPLELCINRIASVIVFNNTYEFDISEVNDCFSLNFTQNEVEEIHNDSHALEEIFRKRGITFKPEDALIISKAELKFKLRTIHFSPVSTDQRPECYLIGVCITFDNSRHTGQVYIYLATEISYVNLCNGRVLQGGSIATDTIIIGVIDVLVLFMCLASLILCCRALVRAHLLKMTAVDYFELVLKRKLPLSDRLEFLNLWYVMIVINDICIVLGTVCKISIEFRDFDNDLFTMTGILLGMGALLVYVGVLRYFCFFSKYNVLILTMKKSLPNILRFMSCAAVLYMGFLVAGWVIIGPYSLKFRTLGKSSEALFSLLNGDDMFATFFTINDTNTIIKIFGTIYIYIFVSLFIYVVLSLFIAIIMDAYEIVKDRYDHGFKIERSLLHEFARSADPHIFSDSEAREQFSSRNLLRLGALESAECFNVFAHFREWCQRRRDANLPYNSFSNPNLVTHTSPTAQTASADDEDSQVRELSMERHTNTVDV
uniref:Polycystin cation channel PKD1/PKD2 domain-containing protein n=1 Tax=Parascaris univalens TaxID=6257 RepID=A0A915BDI8_PARUN